MLPVCISEQSSISDDPISSHPSSQLQQKDHSQPDFLSREPHFHTSKSEPDFLSSKPESRTTDFFNFSQAEKQKQKEARAQISPEVTLSNDWDISTCF